MTALLSGQLEVVVELPKEKHLTMQPSRVAYETTVAFFQRIVGIANQLGLQGRMLTGLETAPQILNYRMAGTVYFQEVADEQLNSIRRTAQSTARKQLQKGNGDNGASQLGLTPLNPIAGAEGATESERPRESSGSAADDSILPFPSNSRTADDPREGD